MLQAHSRRYRALIIIETGCRLLEYKRYECKDSLIQEIEQVPDSLITEVLDFLQFLKQKHQSELLEVTVLSESSLSKDWLNSSEDGAWQNL